MRGLYGVQPRYLPDVLRHGFYRESAAFFLIPENPKPETLRATLSCAVYHAIGLSVWNEAARTGKTVSQVMDYQGLAFVWMEDIPKRDTLWDRYRIGPLMTYPYTKLRAFGPVNTEKMSVMHLDSQLLEQSVSTREMSPRLRFFQKAAGTQQYLSGVDMEALERMCTHAADHLIRTYNLAST